MSIDPKNKQFPKQQSEISKPNLRARNSTNSWTNVREFPQKKPVSKALREKTPIKSQEIARKAGSFNEEAEKNEKKQAQEPKKMHFLIKDESPWTKFCKRDLSPLKNSLFSPSRPKNQPESEIFSQNKIMTNQLIEYQTPSPSLWKKGESLDFSPFLRYTAKKVIQKLDFSNVEDHKKSAKNGEMPQNSVIVCFKSPTFNFLNKKFETDEDFVYSNQKAPQIPAKDGSSDNGDDEIVRLLRDFPESFAKNAAKPREIAEKNHEKLQETHEKFREFPKEIKGFPEKFSDTVATIKKKAEIYELSGKTANIRAAFATPKDETRGISEKIAKNSQMFDATVSKLRVFQEIGESSTENVKSLADFRENSAIAPKKIICNCKKSRCLKLYCDCFRAGEFCGKDCNCCSCANVVENQEERYNSMVLLMERNAQAFLPKYEEETGEKNVFAQENSGKIRHAKGCNCKKSNCLKKYCECYQAGIKCTDLCKCDGCKNTENCHIFKKRKFNNFAEVHEFEEFKPEISNFQTNLQDFRGNSNAVSNLQGNLNNFQVNSFTFGYGQENEGKIREESQDSNLSFNENGGFGGKNKGFARNFQGKKIK